MSYVTRHGRRIEIVDVDMGVIAKAKLKPKKATFVQMPMAWVDKLAAQRSCAAWLMAMRLLHLAFQNHNQPIVLGNVTMRQLGIGRAQKWRMLVRLERLGLISIVRHPRRAPRITLYR
jgi:hypothetical protein